MARRVTESTTSSTLAPRASRRSVKFTTKEEDEAGARLERLLKKERERFHTVYSNFTEVCPAPVFTVEQDGGRTTTIALFPPFFPTYMESLPITFDFSTMIGTRAKERQKVLRFPMRPAVPSEYVCRPKQE